MPCPAEDSAMLPRISLAERSLWDELAWLHVSLTEPDVNSVLPVSSHSDDATWIMRYSYIYTIAQHTKPVSTVTMKEQEKKGAAQCAESLTLFIYWLVHSRETSSRGILYLPYSRSHWVC